MAFLQGLFPPCIRELRHRNLSPVWAMASQVVTSAGNFVTSVIIVRELGLIEFGRFSIAFLIVMIVRNFLNGAVLTPMSVIAPKLRPATAPAYRGFLLTNGLGFSLGVSMLLYLITGALGQLISSPWLPDVALPLALANFTSNFADYFRRYEFVRFRPAWAFWIDGVRYMVQLGVLGALALFWHQGFTPQTALYAIALGGLAGCIFGAMIYGNLAHNRSLNRSLWLRHWKFVKWMTPGVVLDSIQSSAPLFIGAALMGEATLGGVRAVQQLANILSLPTNAMQQVAPSMAARRFQQGGLHAMTKLLGVLLALAMAMLILSSGIVLAGWDLVCGMLFKSHAPELLVIFLLYSLLNFESLLKQMFFVFFQSSENPRVFLETGLLGAVVTVVAILVLASYLNEIAIPMASIIANTAAIAFLLFRLGQTFARYRPPLAFPGKA